MLRIRTSPGQALVIAFLLGLTREAAAYRCPQSPSPAKTEAYQGFLGRVYARGDQELPYRLFVPKNYDPTKVYPLVLYLHHAGLAGDDANNDSDWDNCVHLTSEIGSGDDYGGVFTHRAVDKSGTRFDTQERYPHFVLAPHAKSPAYGFGGGVEGSASKAEHPTRPLLLGILAEVQAEFKIDPARLYVTGISMGCYGTWDIIMRKPGVFAAAAPQSCRGDPDKALLAPLKDLPIWSMCGTNDSYFAGAQKMADAMTAVGATASTFTFTAMQGVGHSINDRGYDYPGFIDWMFAQRRPGVGPGSGGGGSASGGAAGLGGGNASGGVGGNASAGASNIGGGASGGVSGLGGGSASGGASSLGGSAASGGVAGLGPGEGGTSSGLGGSAGSTPQSTGGVATSGGTSGATGGNSQAGDAMGGGQPAGGTPSSGGTPWNGHADETSDSGCSVTRSPGSASSSAALFALVAAAAWSARRRREKIAGARM